MSGLGILIKYKEQTVEWGEAKIATTTNKTNQKQLHAALLSTQ